LLMLVACPLFCATINVSVDRLVYKPLRNAPKLAPLVSALGVSFIFMNIGLFWKGSYELDVPNVLPKGNLLEHTRFDVFQLTWNDLLVVVVTVPTMIALTLFVKYTALGKA